MGESTATRSTHSVCSSRRELTSLDGKILNFLLVANGALQHKCRTQRRQVQTLECLRQQTHLDAGDVADAHLAIGHAHWLPRAAPRPQERAALNGSFGVVLRLDGGSGRLVVRKEVAPPGEAPTVTVKPANLRPAPPLDGPAVQALVDAAPAGARVTLPRGTIAAPAAAASSTAAPIALRLPRALTLAGVGSKTGGTVLSGFSVVVGEEVDGGGLRELVGFHVSGGAVDVSPMELSRVRLSDVSVTAPAGTMAAVYIDEIGTQLLGAASAERVVLDGCWVRGGVNGVVVNAVGCTLRHCRAQGAAQYGVHANASVALEACTVGVAGRASSRAPGSPSCAARAGSTRTASSATRGTSRTTASRRRRTRTRARAPPSSSSRRRTR